MPLITVMKLLNRAYKSTPVSDTNLLRLHCKGWLLCGGKVNRLFTKLTPKIHSEEPKHE